MKCFFDEIIDSTFKDGEGIFVFVFNDLVIIVLLLWVRGFLVILWLFKHMLSLLLNLQHLLRRLKDARLDLLNFVKILPLLHPILPCECPGVYVIGAQQNIQIPQR